MSHRTDSNVLFSRHLPEMRSYLQLDGISLHLVQRGLLTERDVIFLHSLEVGDLQCCHLVRLLKKTRNAFESFMEALEEEVASDYSANAHGHGQLVENMRGSLAALQSAQGPRSRSGSEQLGVPDHEPDASSRSTSPLSGRSWTAGSDGTASAVCSRQSMSPSLSPEPFPLPKSESFDSITTADSLKALGDLAQKVLNENWELREALNRKSRECEELRQELAKAQAKKPTRIPVPSQVHNDHHTLPAGEGCRRVEPIEVVQGRGLQRPNTASPSLRAASSGGKRKGPSKLPPIFH